MSRYPFLLLCLVLPGLPAAASDTTVQQLIDQQQYVEAGNRSDEILEQQPDNTRVKFQAAYAYQMQGLEDRAIELYQAVIRDAPELPEPRNNLAMIYLDRGDYDRASELLVDAINTHPSYATAYDNLSRVYKGIASEAYRRAVSESSEPASVIHDIDLVAIRQLPDDYSSGDPISVAAITGSPANSATASDAVTEANLQTRMIETVLDWSEAWSSKDFDRYIEAYMPAYRASFPSRNQWVEHRRSRILRPGDIRVDVSDFSVKQRTVDQISVDFTQAFRSPTYQDKVVKRLDFLRIGGTWKIASERVLSVL